MDREQISSPRRVPSSYASLAASARGITPSSISDKQKQSIAPSASVASPLLHNHQQSAFESASSLATSRSLSPRRALTPSALAFNSTSPTRRIATSPTKSRSSNISSSSSSIPAAPRARSPPILGERSVPSELNEMDSILQMMKQGSQMASSSKRLLSSQPSSSTPAAVPIPASAAAKPSNSQPPARVTAITSPIKSPTSTPVLVRASSHSAISSLTFSLDQLLRQASSSSSGSAPAAAAAAAQQASNFIPPSPQLQQQNASFLQSEVNKLVDMNSELVQMLEQSSTQYKSSQKDLYELREQYVLLEQERDEIREGLNDMGSRVGLVSSIVNSLRDERDALRNENEALKKEKQYFSDAMESLRSEKKTSDDKIIFLENALRSFEEERKSFTARLSSSGPSGPATSSSIVDQLEKSRSENMRSMSALTSSLNEIKSLEKTIKELKGQVGSRADQSNEMSRLQNQISDLSSALERERKSGDAVLMEFEETIGRLGFELQETRTVKDAMQEQLKQAAKQHSDLQNELENLRRTAQESVELEQQKLLLSLEREHRERKIAEQRAADLESEINEISTYREKCLALTSDVSRLTDELATATRDKMSLRDSYLHILQEKASATKQSASMMQRISDLESELARALTASSSSPSPIPSFYQQQQQQQQQGSNTYGGYQSLEDDAEPESVAPAQSDALYLNQFQSHQQQISHHMQHQEVEYDEDEDYSGLEIAEVEPEPNALVSLSKLDNHEFMPIAHEEEEEKRSISIQKPNALVSLSKLDNHEFMPIAHEEEEEQRSISIQKPVGASPAASAEPVISQHLLPAVSPIAAPVVMSSAPELSQPSPVSVPIVPVVSSSPIPIISSQFEVVSPSQPLLLSSAAVPECNAMSGLEDIPAVVSLPSSPSSASASATMTSSVSATPPAASVPVPPVEPAAPSAAAESWTPLASQSSLLSFSANSSLGPIAPLSLPMLARLQERQLQYPSTPLSSLLPSIPERPEIVMSRPSSVRNLKAAIDMALAGGTPTLDPLSPRN